MGWRCYDLWRFKRKGWQLSSVHRAWKKVLPLVKSVNTSLTKTWRGGQKNQHMSTMMTLSGYTLLVERNPSLFNFAGWRKEKNLTWKLPGMRRPTAQSSVWGVLHFNAIRFNRLNFPSYPPTSKALINIRHNLASGALHNINLSRDFQFIIHWRMMSCDFFFRMKESPEFLLPPPR